MRRNQHGALGDDDEEVDHHRTAEDWRRLPMVQLQEKTTPDGLSNAVI